MKELGAVSVERDAETENFKEEILERVKRFGTMDVMMGIMIMLIKMVIKMDVMKTVGFNQILNALDKMEKLHFAILKW